MYLTGFEHTDKGLSYKISWFDFKGEIKPKQSNTFTAALPQAALDKLTAIKHYASQLLTISDPVTVAGIKFAPKFEKDTDEYKSITATITCQSETGKQTTVPIRLRLNQGAEPETEVDDDGNRWFPRKVSETVWKFMDDVKGYYREQAGIMVTGL